jgi:hypothetical protein
MAKILRPIGFTFLLAVTFVFAPASAQAGDTPRAGIWMASTDGALSSMGTLTLKDGKLSFRTNKTTESWEVDLSDARRVELSKALSNAIELETGWGEIYVVRILNARLMPESPSKAFKQITGVYDSVKVVRVNGGQIR